MSIRKYNIWGNHKKQKNLCHSGADYNPGLYNRIIKIIYLSKKYQLKEQ